MRKKIQGKKPPPKKNKQHGGNNSMNAKVSKYDLDYNFEVKKNGSSDIVEFDLKSGQSIVSNGGCMNYMREGVDRGKLSNSAGGGIFSGFGRMFSGQSLYLVKYTGLNTPNRFVAFSSAIPKSILHLVIQPGQELQINRGSFIASSPNVDISGKLNWRGIFEFGQEEGLVLPKLTSKGNREGHVWLGMFGHYQKHALSKGQSLLVDNGLFLASIASENKDEPVYTIEDLGKGFVSTVVGGEGLGMHFEGPRVVYTQSHHFVNFGREISSVISKR